MNPKKVICPCYHVTKGDIIQAVEDGATSFKEVKKATKVSKGCGKCKKKAKKFVKKITEIRKELLHQVHSFFLIQNTTSDIRY